MIKTRPVERFGPATTYRAGQIPAQRRLPVAKKPGKVKWGRVVTLSALGFVIFLTGLTLGHVSTLASPEAHRPDQATLAILHYAQSQAKPGWTCYAEWREQQNDYEVICHQG